MTTASGVRLYRILVALADERRETLQQYLEQAGFSVLQADSKKAAELVIRQQPIDAVVMISDWALASNKGKSEGLMECVRGKIPTVSLITKTTWQDAHERWFGYLYLPPLHEYCSLPISTDQMIIRLNKVLEVAANSVNGRDE